MALFRDTLHRPLLGKTSCRLHQHPFNALTPAAEYVLQRPA